MPYLETSGHGATGEHAAAWRAAFPTTGSVVHQGQRRRFDQPGWAVELDQPAPSQSLPAGMEALALVGLAAAVVDSACRVLAANSVVEAMTNHVRWQPNGRLALVDQQSDVQLRQALAALFSAYWKTPSSIACRSATGEVAVVRLVPMRGGTREVFEDGLAMLLVTPVTTPKAPEAALIRDLFGLSASEARVACAIADGETVNRIAAKSGVSRETVRTQLKSVMAKTGTSRQAETAVLLASLSDQWPARLTGCSRTATTPHTRSRRPSP